MAPASITEQLSSALHRRTLCRAAIELSGVLAGQVLRRMGLLPEGEADELEALGERVAVAAAAGVEADAEMGEVPDEFTVRRRSCDGAADPPSAVELSLGKTARLIGQAVAVHV